MHIYVLLVLILCYCIFGRLDRIFSRDMGKLFCFICDEKIVLLLHSC